MDYFAMKLMKKHILLGLLLGSLIIQSFQCASPEFTGAKLAYNQKDYKKAMVSLEKEVAKNPNNAEAWYLLADCHFRLNDFKKAVEHSMQASKYATKEPMKSKVADQTFFLWAELYNKSTNSYNEILGKGKSADIQEIIELLEMATKLKPENTEPLALMGNVYEIKGDTANAMSTYERYVAQIKPNVEIMKKNNLTIGMSREDALRILGKAVSSKSFMDNNGDSLIIDRLSVNGNDAYLSSAKKEGGKALIEGIRSQLPSAWLQAEKERFYAINLRPLVNLAYLYYGSKSYDKAVEMIDFSLALNPIDDELSSLKIQIYDEQGKSEEVLKSLEISVGKNPNNKFYLEQYARVLARQKQYEKAIVNYEKALAIDPNFENAIFNIGACYVNQAVDIIDEENKKIDANSKYKPDESRYFPLLNKAADFFTQYRTNPVNKDNLGVLQQLSDIYLITRQNDKFKKMITDLEAAEPANLTNAAYYEYMGKVYAKQGLKDKADKAFQMADMLKKNQ
jgi:tetratricopeptide (TPR) repeat protein